MSGKPDDPAAPPEQRTIFQPARPAPVPGGFPAAAAPVAAAPMAAAPMAAPAADAGVGVARLDFAPGEPVLFGPEPLVAAAGRLMRLASQVRSMPIGPDLKALRQMVVGELEAFGKRAQGMGFDAKTMQLAHYILCAFMDDAVMSTPWGANSVWSQHSLLAAYHNDTQGGDRLFQFAERMEQDPSREPRLMELLYQCLSLGFEGRAALDPRGGSLLQQRRSKLAAAIAGRQGLAGGDLSPQWKGVEAAGGSYQPRVPLWAIITGLGVVALVIFSALLFRLSSQTDAAIAALNQAVGNSQIVPAPPAPETATPTFDQIRAILAPDIGSGRVVVAREGNDIVLRLANQELFGSAQADPSGSWAPTFGRLAEAANLTKGPLRIEGHTDHQPLRLSLQYPSNLELSVARARAVAAAVTAAGLADPKRAVVAGLGDAQPLADNASADGRRQNRRVEIRVANDVNWR